MCNKENCSVSPHRKFSKRENADWGGGWGRIARLFGQETEVQTVNLRPRNLNGPMAMLHLVEWFENERFQMSSIKTMEKSCFYDVKKSNAQTC